MGYDAIWSLHVIDVRLRAQPIGIVSEQNHILYACVFKSGCFHGVCDYHVPDYKKEETHRQGRLLLQGGHENGAALLTDSCN